MLKKVFNLENIIVCIATIVINYISINYLQPKIFYEEISSKESNIIINILFILFLVILLKSLICVIKKVIAKDQFYINWIKYSAIYAVIMATYLILVYPGTWFYDEFWVIQYAREHLLAGWQSYISVILYTFVFYLFPHPIALTIFQIIAISLIVGYLQVRIYNIYRKKLYNVIIYILFSTPVFLINNLYLLRATMYSYVVLLFYVIIFFDFYQKEKLTIKKLIFLIFLSFFMVKWRSEGIVFLISNPICMYLTYNKENIKKKITAFMVVVVCICIVYSNISTKYSSIKDTKMYTATVTVIPLSIMLNQDLKGENLDKDLEILNQTFDLEILKLYPNYHFMQAYWDGFITKNVENVGIEFYLSFADIVLNNMDKFLDVRWKVFLQTFKSVEYPNNCYKDYITYQNMSPSSRDIVGKTVEKFNFLPLNYDLKYGIEDFLTKNIVVKTIFWNLIPLCIFIGMIYIFVARLLRKDKLYVIVIATLVFKMAIVFLTATASYYMYYFAEYIVGMFLILICIFNKLSKKRIKVLKS